MHEPNLSEIQKEYHGSMHSYVIGFTASFILTLLSFGLVYFRFMSRRALVITLVSLALVQALFQLRYFLKLGFEDHPKWESFVFGFMVLVLLVIALGSLWIMYDLDNRLMSNM